jgi:hypothetical protein
MGTNNALSRSGYNNTVLIIYLSRHISDQVAWQLQSLDYVLSSVHLDKNKNGYEHFSGLRKVDHKK